MKTSSLPIDWTLSRWVKTFVCLGIYILVPGLHQLAIKRRILGILLFVGYLVGTFVISNQPLNFVEPSSFSTDPFYKLLDVVRWFSWILLAVDIRNLGSTNLSLRFLLPVAFFVAVQFMPFHGNRDFSIFVEQEDDACPVFCKHDIISFEFLASLQHKFSVGDHIVLRKLEYDGEFFQVPKQGNKLYTSRILAKPKANSPPCPDDYYNWINPSLPKALCPQGDDESLYDYIVFGGTKTGIKLQNDINYSMISKHMIEGHKPKLIGNLREYHLWWDASTERLGRTLLAIYYWTRINLFGITKIFD